MKIYNLENCIYIRFLQWELIIDKHPYRGRRKW